MSKHEYLLAVASYEGPVLQLHAVADMEYVEPENPPMWAGDIFDWTAKNPDGSMMMGEFKYYNYLRQAEAADIQFRENTQTIAAVDMGLFSVGDAVVLTRNENGVIDIKPYKDSQQEGHCKNPACSKWGANGEFHDWCWPDCIS